MSVLIKGMRMPKSCRECHFIALSYNMPVCFITKQIPTYPLQETLEQALSKRMNGCPLVAVSEGQEEWLNGMNVLYGEEEKPRYCDRNICTKNEYNGISCDECEVAKYHNLEDDDSPCQNCGVEE